MASQIKRTKVTPRKKPCKPRGVPSGKNGVGARKTRLSSIQKVLMGKGMIHRTPPGQKGNGTKPKSRKSEPEVTEVTTA